MFILRYIIALYIFTKKTFLSTFFCHWPSWETWLTTDVCWLRRSRSTVYFFKDMNHSVTKFFFLDFPIYLQSVYIHSNTISKLCVDKRGRIEECSVATLRDKRVKTLCGCREKGYKLRLTTKAYKLFRLLYVSFPCIMHREVASSLDVSVT
jgi:hypothetical protein